MPKEVYSNETCIGVIKSVCERTAYREWVNSGPSIAIALRPPIAIGSTSHSSTPSLNRSVGRSVNRMHHTRTRGIRRRERQTVGDDACAVYVCSPVLPIHSLSLRQFPPLPSPSSPPLLIMLSLLRARAARAAVRTPVQARSMATGKDIVFGVSPAASSAVHTRDRTQMTT